MKKRKSICDYTLLRNSLLIRAFYARLGRDGKTINEIISDLAAMPAPRFFISEERAYALLCTPDLESDPRRLPRSIVMIKEIKSRVECLRRADPSLSLKQALSNVIYSPAPSFFLTPSSIKSIIYKNLCSPPRPAA